MITIVFVDDEPNVLAAVRRAGHQRSDWTMHFAANATEALDLISTLPRVDVLVTDMQMPGMDGAALLSTVRDRAPHVARVVLSGQSDLAAVLSAAGPAHRFLTKPTSFDELAATIDGVTREVGDMGDRARVLVGRAGALHSPPELLGRISAVLESVSGSFHDIARLIEHDVALSAELMKLVNSAFFGHFGRVSSVESAVSLLGLDTIRALIVERGVFTATSPMPMWLDVVELGRQARAIALGARGLALRDGASSAAAAEAFLTGMVADIGVLVLAQTPVDDRDLAGLATVTWPQDVERERFGVDRFVVSAVLLSLWGFEREVVDAVHGLSTRGDADASTTRWYVTVARQLILDSGIDAEHLADASEPISDLEGALDAAHSGRR